MYVVAAKMNCWDVREWKMLCFLIDQNTAFKKYVFGRFSVYMDEHLNILFSKVQIKMEKIVPIHKCIRE